jgi:predicted RNase H-like HicB family nuclease
VPPKIRELIADLQAAGFVDRGGKGSHRNRGVEKMKDSARYVKIVEWSHEDHCYVGSSPGLIYGGCHGDDEKAVFDELCRIVEDAIELYRREGRPLPPPTSGRDFANKMQDVA